jgi:hypothetical protein
MRETKIVVAKEYKNYREFRAKFFLLNRLRINISNQEIFLTVIVLWCLAEIKNVFNIITQQTF